MKWQQVFLTGDHVRPIWRFFLSAALFFLVYVGVAFALGIAFGRLHYRARPLTALFWLALLLLPALIAVCRVLTTLFERKPLRSVGVAFHGTWKVEFGIGACLGGLMILLVALLERLLGVAGFTWNTVPSSHLISAGLWTCALLVIAACNEELTFRGYPFQRLVEAIGPVPAVAVTSALFGAVHLGNPHHTWVSTLNTMLVGVPLAAGYLRTRMLWLPIGLHFAWNFVQGFVLGLPVSGLLLPDMMLKAEVRETPWLTGGSYGPEASVLTSGVIVLATLYVLFSKSIHMTDEARALTSPGAPDLVGVAADSAETGNATGPSTTVSNSSGLPPN